MAVFGTHGLMSMIKNYFTPISNKQNKTKCFFDLQVNGKHKGKIVMELNEKTAPRLSANFRALCIGTVNFDESGDQMLHYKGSKIHGIHSAGILVGGDFQNGDGTGGISVFGSNFTLNEEEKKLESFGAGTLGMIIHPKEQISSQFIVITGKQCVKPKNMVAFGQVTEGLQLLNSLKTLGDEDGIPTAEVVIQNCGELS